jgi:hypothetical protein
MSDDPKISRRYRELPREEPPRHVDDAILSAARRAAAPRRSRWYVPVAAAAIIVLAVAVTVHVQRERPEDAERVVPMKAEPSAPAAEEPRVMQAPAPATKGFAPDPKPQAAPAPSQPPAPLLADSAAPGREEYERRAAAADLARLHAPREQSRAEEEPRRQQRARAEISREAPAAAAALGAAADRRSPEQWLLGIDDLKRQGKHEEAERQLAEFRKRYPDYRIPEAMLQKFEK